MRLLSRRAETWTTVCRSALLLFVLLGICAGQTAPSDLSGGWQLEMTFPTGLITKFDMNLEQKGTELSGDVTTATGTYQIKGTVKEGDIEFTEIIKGYDAQFKGKQTSTNTLEGTMDSPPFGKGKWTAKR
jgi:hypothetical protein